MVYLLGLTESASEPRESSRHAGKTANPLGNVFMV